MLFTFEFEGNLAADAELKITESGTTYCQLKVGHNTRRRNKDGEWENGPTMWVAVTAWEGLAERCSQLKKGNTVLVTCRDDLRPWAYLRNDNGQPGALLEVTAANVALSLRFKPAEVIQPTTEPWAIDEPETSKVLEPSF
ncbi:single-stranded DNA-binding protein [Actinoplanes oblitus]|uniref:Single-stranded DNA-binding protein n=1 Tax=Actinoplanes oblitus TaxID=3040509 RepID=A0ABY8WQT6_9ACTN|nr:single-stranded DNA-binding protein [Actinoplanes oblitus]WIN00014.1 single-stranded DNA-binding protein [Actinoplanes oblitus]